MSVSYTASDDCPPRSLFIGNLLARTQRLRLVEAGDTAFTVLIERHGAASAGSLAVVTPDGAAPAVREVEADTCSEVVEALALVAALTVDPDAKTAPLSEAAVVEAASAVALDGEPESAASPEPPPVAGEEASRPSPRPDPGPAPKPEAPKPAPTPPPRRELGLEAALGAQVELAHAPFGRPFPAGRAFAEVGAAGTAIFRPAVGASFAWGTDSVEGYFGAADLAWLAGRVELCPVDLLPAARLALRPCAAFELGLVRGAGKVRELPLAARSAEFLWASAALLGRLEVMPAGPVLLRLEPALLAPFVPEAAFELSGPEGTETVLDVPRVSYALGVAAGLRFP